MTEHIINTSLLCTPQQRSLQIKLYEIKTERMPQVVGPDELIDMYYVPYKLMDTIMDYVDSIGGTQEGMNEFMTKRVKEEKEEEWAKL